MLRINAYLAIAVAIFFLLNSFFVVDNQQLKLRIQALAETESELIEQNKQSLIAISLLRSPKYLFNIINRSDNFQLRSVEQVLNEVDLSTQQVQLSDSQQSEAQQNEGVSR